MPTAREDDGRDVFDKALDYAPIGGAVVGGLLARKLFRRKGFSIVRNEKMAEEAKRHLRDALREGNKADARILKENLDLFYGRAPSNIATIAGAYGGAALGSTASLSRRKKK